MPLAYIKFLSGAGARPEHPIVIPPDGLAPGVPTHPIIIPPEVSHPIVIPPGSIAPGVPTHPIVIPPAPDQGLPPTSPGAPDQGLPPTSPGAPDQGLPPTSPGTPGTPGTPGAPDQGLPGSLPGIDNALPIAMPPLPKDLQPGEIVLLGYGAEGTASWTVIDASGQPKSGGKRK